MYATQATQARFFGQRVESAGGVFLFRERDLPSEGGEVNVSWPSILDFSSINSSCDGHKHVHDPLRTRSLSTPLLRFLGTLVTR